MRYDMLAAPSTLLRSTPGLGRRRPLPPVLIGVATIRIFIAEMRPLASMAPSSRLYDVGRYMSCCMSSSRVQTT